MTALAPAELDALTRARPAQQQVDKALRAIAERELERKRYAVALAERQFNRVDPDSRLVAGELERRWEAALSELRAAEKGLARPPAEPARRTELGQDLNNKVVALFDSLPQIWTSGTTTDAHRKALLRCLIEKVVLDRGERDIALARIVWRGGAKPVDPRPYLAQRRTTGRQAQYSRQLDLRTNPTETSPYRSAAYMLKRQDGFRLFLDDGRVDIDSNLVENAIRSPAMNRRNALFAGHDEGGRNWARFASLIASCKMNGVEPYAYLRDLFISLANGHLAKDIDALMPWAYAQRPSTS